MDPSNASTDTIKLVGGLGAADLKSLTPMSSHLKETFRSPGAAFTGGFARIGMKQMATSMNLYVPGEFRAAYPFMSNFAVGLGFSPILNIPRMMQLGRISGLTYPQVIKKQFFTMEGLKGYGQNTLVFGPGEGFRMMMCFGTKDFLMPQIGGKANAHEVHASAGGIPLYTAKMAIIAGPAVAAVETTSSLVTETVSTIQAGIQNAPAGTPKRDFMTVLKETITPSYAGRCWMSLFTKNVMANTPLFWFMFAADFYGRIAADREAAEKK